MYFEVHDLKFKPLGSKKGVLTCKRSIDNQWFIACVRVELGPNKLLHAPCFATGSGILYSILGMTSYLNKSKIIIDQL